MLADRISHDLRVEKRSPVRQVCNECQRDIPGSSPKGLFAPTVTEGSVAVGLKGFESCDGLRVDSFVGGTGFGAKGFSDDSMLFRTGAAVALKGL